MTLTAAQFRADFPEFDSTTKFTNSEVEYWMGIGYMLLNANRWRNMLDTGVELFIAHNLALEAKAKMDSAGNGIPGLSNGIVSSKSVDKVSISYDTNSAIEKDAGHWNLTIYGLRLIRLIKLFGAGPIQVGIGTPVDNSGQAWPGPIGSSIFGQ